MKPIQQQGEHDCGAACLAAIATHYGCAISLAEVRLLLPPGQAAIADIEHAAATLGFEHAAIRAADEHLAEAQLPCMALLTDQGALPHYVVICHVSARWVRVMDPATGKFCRYTRSSFNIMWEKALILLMPKAAFGHQEGQPPLLRQVWLLLYPHRRAVGAAIIATACYAMLSYASAFFVAAITDHVLPQAAGGLLLALGVVMLANLCLQQSARTWQSLLLLRISRKLDARLIGGFCRHLLRLPLVVFDRYRTGELLTRVGNAVRLREFACNLAIQCATPLFTVVLLLPLLLSSHYQLALLFAGAMVCYLVGHLLASRLNRRGQYRLIAAQAGFEAELTHTLHTVGTHRLAGTEALAATKLESRLAKVLHADYHSGLNRIFSETAADTIAQGTTLALLWIGGALVLEGALTLGEVLAVYALSGYFHRAAYQLAHLSQTWHDARVANEHLQDLQTIPPAEAHHATLLQPDRIGDIHFQRVCFAYHRGLPVFEALDCHFPAGRITVVTGESGSGKSTLVHLLTKRYPTSSGTIRLGRHALHLIGLETIQRRMGIVAQHLDFTAGTIAENVCAPAMPDADRLAALFDDLGLTGFINALPLGWDTPIGERGATLSGGERQRIAIARALYKQPQVLVLDEGTASLDAEAEAAVHRCLAACRQQGITIIFISHRPRSLAIADHHIHLTPIHERQPQLPIH
ncbi:bacteriocin cleavage/export ABC transporter [Parapedobacter pyrenivorans]|uniref:Bacteriocin cleavage/export ABC transporter n=1 Tax=Parapedobacter pyrenivorans TaxID=1305674 RepID=A0A917HXH3_9SPHI|nr:peptidase domain-containing ABC transporter [Parapedobacter pyrenivorans]GGG94049.1 bacteriocin cleavage/export ABC transporter [Parapedobacter pyrenivorans]